MDIKHIFIFSGEVNDSVFSPKKNLLHKLHKTAVAGCYLVGFSVVPSPSPAQFVYVFITAVPITKLFYIITLLPTNQTFIMLDERAVTLGVPLPRGRFLLIF